MVMKLTLDLRYSKIQFCLSGMLMWFVAGIQVSGANSRSSTSGGKKSGHKHGRKTAGAMKNSASSPGFYNGDVTFCSVWICCQLAFILLKHIRMLDF